MTVGHVFNGFDDDEPVGYESSMQSANREACERLLILLHAEHPERAPAAGPSMGEPS